MLPKMFNSQLLIVLKIIDLPEIKKVTIIKKIISLIMRYYVYKCLFVRITFYPSMNNSKK